jgi:choline-sulfatase
MTRKEFLKTGLAMTAAPFHARAQRGARPRNVLLLMSDEHRRDALGIEGNRIARTPNLDALARSGVCFRSAYCANPVCTPSRASLLTGLYTHHHQTWNNATPWPFEHKTLAHYFGRAGYMTALIGKMHFVDAQTHGFDYHLDFNDWYQYLGPKTKLYADELSRANSGSGLPQIDDLWRDFGDPWKAARTLDSRQGSVAVGRASEIPEQDHFDNFVARETVRFLKTHGKRQPFFAICSCLKPHDPFMPARRFASMFRAPDMQLPPTWGKVDLAQAPKEVQDLIRFNGPTPELSDPAQAKQRIALYYANLAQLDDALGQVLSALRELDLERDTIVLYTSDHGELLGDHGLWQKFQFYESSAGVPLIVRAPGVTTAGARCEMPVSQVQVLPTLAELCGVPVPPLDGPSLLPQLRNVETVRDLPVYSEYNLQTPRAKYMLRRNDFKYTFRVNDMPELYDIRRDPDEMINLALKPEHRERAEQMKRELFAWYTPPELSAAPPQRKNP